MAKKAVKTKAVPVKRGRGRPRKAAVDTSAPNFPNGHVYYRPGAAQHQPVQSEPRLPETPAELFEAMRTHIKGLDKTIFLAGNLYPPLNPYGNALDTSERDISECFGRMLLALARAP